MNNPPSILDEVSKVSIRLLLSEPFFGHFFAGLIKKESTQIPTLAVGYEFHHVILYINRDFWNKHLQLAEWKLGVLKHEVLHLVFMHVTRMKDFKNKAIFNIAADLVVNQCIASHQLPPGAIQLDTFPELALRAEDSTEYYYETLYNFYEQQLEKEGKGIDCSQNKAWQNLKRLLEGFPQEQHALWEAFEKLSGAEQDLVKQQLKEMLNNSLKTNKHGNTAGYLQQYLQQFQEQMRPKVDWRRMLKIFASSSRKTYLRNTLKRPSKRYGTAPGIKVKKKNKMLVAIDTSGSIEMRELALFFSEIYHIWRQGAEIWVVECDVEIHNTYLYKGKAPEAISGRGGTAFEAPIQYANEVLRPDALIYFTDGFGNAPHLKSRCPVLWLLSPGGSSPDKLKAQHFQGRFVKMDL